ncbi:MAG: DUF1963 domain-containing protein [Clostridia bacterium]|nr:DUF1963 domain-containing protein [Clostridia bacterium]
MKRRIVPFLLSLCLLAVPSCAEDAVTEHNETELQEDDMTQQEFFEMLPAIAKTAVTVDHAKPEGEIALGQSKIGGKPHLPADFEWPTYHGMGILDDEKATRPLSFMAQINLADVKPYDAENVLPESGMLYFFYDMETMRWGYDPEDEGCCRVYWIADGTALTEHELPAELDEMYRIPERAITFGTKASYPMFDEVNERYTVEWESDRPWQAYMDELERLGASETDSLGMNSQLLGYPELVQNSMLRECELASNGVYTGNGFPEMTDAEAADLRARSQDWVLLYQFGSIMDGVDEVMFGDLGSIYFCIRRQDLAARAFDKVWLILQCG